MVGDAATANNTIFAETDHTPLKRGVNESRHEPFVSKQWILPAGYFTQKRCRRPVRGTPQSMT
jgi:hypothetical protein